MNAAVLLATATAGFVLGLCAADWMTPKRTYEKLEPVYGPTVVCVTYDDATRCRFGNETRIVRPPQTPMEAYEKWKKE